MTRTEIRIIYGDTDQMGVVYHGIYPSVAEAKVNYSRFQNSASVAG
jgi:acyl-CoA thioesterase FadM